ncbi:hypothetical protein SAMN04487886_107610 [Clostridium sp. DSM 8431]|uniref:SDR family NAD(P)-dependent oxidoreductase n=1 Tax=Clostridium sp. DSM 8431 TaxID=1761781 RepID=UPI0008E9904B|nr:SDR family oxidoreductase [Clostridium sp. DSM 8431]SFU61659.1 hypothetical protein SAMN04487886_107610 [Clostridium sp. DSM 8431]
MNILNKYTLITGGTEGIGLELAKLFAKDKHNLIIVARNEERLERVQKEIERDYKVKVEIISLDLSIEESYEKIYDFVEKNNYFVDNLINNAGLGCFGYFKDLDINKQDTLIKVNVLALTNLTHYFLGKMIEVNEGGILNVASTAAFSSGPKMSTYYASKAFVLSLTEAIHEEVKGSKIKVSCLCPGAVKTSFQKKAEIVKNEKAAYLLMNPKEVARCAYEGYKKGNVIIIPGTKNKLLVLANKFIPRSLARKIVLSANK